MAQKKSQPATEPNLRCPFTGERLEILHNAVVNAYYIRGPFYTTRMYCDRDELVWDFTMRGGVAPAFARTTRIQVTDRGAPPSHPFQDWKDGHDKTKTDVEQRVDELM